jgi:hypothetical protein
MTAHNIDSLHKYITAHNIDSLHKYILIQVSHYRLLGASGLYIS